MKASNSFPHNFDALNGVNFVSKFKPKEGEKYCYALALSGGGSFGCYETGVVWGLLHYGNPDDYRWDVFTGISAGSINAGMMAVWPKGSEVEMSENISYMETINDPANVIASWPGHLPGPIEGFFTDTLVMLPIKILPVLQPCFCD